MRLLIGREWEVIACNLVRQAWVVDQFEIRRHFASVANGKPIRKGMKSERSASLGIYWVGPRANSFQSSNWSCVPETEPSLLGRRRIRGGNCLSRDNRYFWRVSGVCGLQRLVDFKLTHYPSMTTVVISLCHNNHNDCLTHSHQHAHPPAPRSRRCAPTTPPPRHFL